MRVPIVESDPNLAQIWCNHIRRLGADVCVLRSQSDAVEALQDDVFDVIILDLELCLGSAMAVADYASYRRPESKVIFVTSNSFFSDGTIFNYMANAAALIPSATKPEDMAALVEHHGR